jgi:carbonic anhydrase
MLTNMINVPTVPPELVIHTIEDIPNWQEWQNESKFLRDAPMAGSGRFHCSGAPLRIRRTMTSLSEILQHNRSFVDRKEYEEFRTDQFPNKKLVVLGCMDTRLVELLPRAMGFRNGDVKLVKNAGAIVSHPFGSVMRSILLAIYELNAEEVMVVGHSGCGMTGLSCERVLDKARARGVSEEVFATLRHSGIDLKQWLTGFEHVEDGVRQSVDMIRNHPLLPPDVTVHGLLMDSESGALKVIVEGYR